MSKYELYINLILENIEKIEKTSNNKSEFFKNEILQDATLMRLQVIGENVKKIPSKIKKKYTRLKWKKFERLRNLISHKYSSVNYELVWDFIQKNLPNLKETIKKIKTQS